MRTIGILLRLTAAGAIGTALVMFLTQAYILISNGVPRDQVPLKDLLLEEMQLDQFAVFGATGGGTLAVLVLAWSGISALWQRGGRGRAAQVSDPHALLRAGHEQLVNQYVDSRRRSARP